MKIKNNLNHPTSPFWGKVAVASAAASAFIATYGLIADIEAFKVAGGILGIIGTTLPIFISDGKDK